MRIFYRALLGLIIIPSVVFMIFAAIADSIAWELEAVLDDLENKGWPQ